MFAFSAETNSTAPSFAAFSRIFSSVKSSERPFLRIMSITHSLNRRVWTIVPLPSGFSRTTLRSWRQPERNTTAGTRASTRMHRLLNTVMDLTDACPIRFDLLHAEREDVLDLLARGADALFGLGDAVLGGAALVDVARFLVERLGLGPPAVLLHLLARLVEVLHRTVEVGERGGDEIPPRLLA